MELSVRSGTSTQPQDVFYKTLVHVLLPLTGVYTTTAARHHSHCRHFIWFLFVHLFFVVARVVDNTLLLMFMQADVRPHHACALV